jgi:hypothetical protein
MRKAYPPIFFKKMKVWVALIFLKNGRAIRHKANYAAFFNYGGHQSQSIEDLCRRAACKLSSAKFKGAKKGCSNPI